MPSTIVETDGFTLFSQPAATYGPFRLQGGIYGVSVGAAGTAQLVKVLADGSTAAVNATAFASNTYNTVTLSPGMYNVVIGTAATTVGVSRIHQF
jgi:hypothetical protein